MCKLIAFNCCCVSDIVHHMQVTDLYDPKEQWASYLINGIKAKEFHTKDVNYIVRNGEVGFSLLVLLERRSHIPVDESFRTSKHVLACLPKRLTCTVSEAMLTMYSVLERL